VVLNAFSLLRVATQSSQYKPHVPNQPTN